MKQFTTEQFTVSTFTFAESSFLVTASLIEKDGKAFLINSGFTQSDAQEILSYMKDKNLTLEKVYLLHGDPDYYFGLEAIKSHFPEVIVYASQETFEHIVASVQGKLAVWGPQLGQEAPNNVILPKIYSESHIAFAGENFEIIGDDSHRNNLYHSASKLLLGGIDVFNETHVFLADTANQEKLQAWVNRLDSLLALDLDAVIASHADAEGSFDKNALEATKAYLLEAIVQLSEAKDSTDFADRMTQAHPDYKNKAVLALGSKVLMGEMTWG